MTVTAMESVIDQEIAWHERVVAKGKVDPRFAKGFIAALKHVRENLIPLIKTPKSTDRPRQAYKARTVSMK